MDDKHLLDNFYVITMVSNPVRFKSRYRLFEDFARRVGREGVKLLAVELSFGERHHKITSNYGDYIELKAWDELWHKENALNIAISRLPSNWEYVAWVDADVEFVRSDWALETAHQLQHYQFVQMFQTAIDLGPTGEAFATYGGFAWSYSTGKPYPISKKYYGYWHPGFAWAARREAIDHVGGLIDGAILGAADHHMSRALIGKAVDTIPPGVHPNYANMVLEWERRATRYIKGDVGFVPGTLLHHWHGKKADRRYTDRWKILKTNQFDPLVDIKRDWQGLYQLGSHKPKLRDDLRAYFRARNEDSIDLE